jgi:hypothetical protein
MKVIDNFLDEEYFNDLVYLFTKPQATGHLDVPWFYSHSISYDGEYESSPTSFYMVHHIYKDYKIFSTYHENMLPLLGKMEKELELRALLRIKANLFPSTSEVIENGMHEDYYFSHFGAVLSLNTCDGYTGFPDGTKVESVANRIVVFDSSKKHCSTSTTNVPARFNININYL